MRVVWQFDKDERRMRAQHTCVIAPHTTTITVQIASPSLNKFTYSHWRTQHAEKSGWHMLLATITRNAPKATGKRRLEIHRYGKRALDIDNLIGGAKCVITDNLRQLQLLRDDSPDMVEFHAENHKLAKGELPHTVIVLRDLETT